ncbi:MAG: ThiF family adenylyltransferase [Deltaproteobacteria bacterium]|nr:ThiF family adenylyltransferase [Deltaproteobacteria bacterium]
MTLPEQIARCAKPLVAPNKKVYSTLSLADRDALAAAAGVLKREVELTALEAGTVPQRYLRNMGSLGVEGQKKLLQSRVFLVGVGGLGGTIAQLLARMGVGTLMVADGDCFSEDNLNRQAFCLEMNVGVSKVQVARAQLAQINAATVVETFEGFLQEGEFASLVKGSSVAIDALDNLPSRFQLEKACKEGGVPLVHGAVAGFKP